VHWPVLKKMTKKLTGRPLSSYLQSLPTFSDNSNEDAIQWLNDITNRFNYIDFTDDQKVSSISEYLDGTARSWLLANVPVVDTWTTFVQAFKKEFAPTWLEEDTMSPVNQCVSTMDKTMTYFDNDIKEKQKCEFLEAKEVNLGCSGITLVESNNIVLFKMCIVETDETNFDAVWPDGSESWFIHNQLPQRSQFIQYEHQESTFTSTSNLDDNFVRENLLNCTDDLSLSAMNDIPIFDSYNAEVFDSLLTLHETYDDVISFFLFLGKLAAIINAYRRIFTRNIAGSYADYNVLRCDTEDRYWFRRLAVP
jgi:hypothetical protein